MATAQTRPVDRSAPQPKDGLDRFFKLTERGSSKKQEGRGGSITYIAMSYIFVLNALIMGTQKDVTGHYLGGGTSPNLVAVATATAVVAAFSSILVGALSNNPLGAATGLGVNAFVTYTVVPTMKWSEAMGLIVIESFLMLGLAVSGFRELAFRVVPLWIKKAFSAGIGAFLVLIGLSNAGIIRSGAGTPLQLGVDGTLRGWPTAVFCIGLAAIFFMTMRGVTPAILYGVVGATVLAVIVEAIFNIGSQTNADGKVVKPTGWSLNVPKWSGNFFSTPDFSSMFHVSFGAFSRVGFPAAAAIIATMLISNFFDTQGTATAVGDEAGILDEDGNPPNLRGLLIADSLIIAAGGVAGVSSATPYIESGAGARAGARTGLAPVFAGLLFVVTMFLASVVKLIPYEAASPALVAVGIIMMRQLKGIDWKDMEVAIPAAITVVLMPFSYSITDGIGAGFIAYVLVKVAVRKFRDIHWLMGLFALLFLLYFMRSTIEAWLGIN